MKVGTPLHDFEALYHRAFLEFRLRALWNVRELEHPTAEEALIITSNLRVEGDLNARRWAEQIEMACRAALSTSVPAKRPQDGAGKIEAC